MKGEKTSGKDRGWRHERTSHPASKLEKALADKWERENIPRTHLNWGCGVLQDLFIDSRDQMLWNRTMIEEMTDRDRMIVATVIQWLGSTCGQCFLEEAANDAGYDWRAQTPPHPQAMNRHTHPFKPPPLRAHADGLTAYEWTRLRDWFAHTIEGVDIKPAHLSFTAGACRDAATAFEAAWHGKWAATPKP